MTTQTAFDLEAFTRATEGDDAAYLLGMYAEDAEIRVVDRNNPPRSPLILNGKAEIGPWIEDTYSRNLTHTVVNPVVGADRVALMTECLYPDGTNVLCSCIADLRDGLVSKQTVVQVWDE
jgi:hypothetical protein